MQAEGTGLHTCLQLSSLFLCSLIFHDSRKDSLCNANLLLSQAHDARERDAPHPALLPIFLVSPVLLLPASRRCEPRISNPSSAEGWPGQEMECGGTGAR